MEMKPMRNAASQTDLIPSRFELVRKKFFKKTDFFGFPKSVLVLIAAPIAISVSFLAFSGSTAPNIPVIPLAADPLYAASGGDKPALALALSVEYPTVGAQYVDPDNVSSSSDDVTYSSDREYLGYYDAESCYTYKNTLLTGETSDNKRFVRRGPAIALSTPNATNPTWTTRQCWDNTKSYSKDDGTSPAFSTTSNDGFSGNFLNWASSSAIDMLRVSLTGGDRVIDTPNLTVLQRAVIPDGDPISMGNSANFPSKRLFKNGTSRAITSANFASLSFPPTGVTPVPYFGAVPTSMATAAGTSDIFVANTLNRIYFGTSKSGNNSGGFGAYTLGSSASTGIYQVGTVASSSASLPNGGPDQMGTISNSTLSKPGDVTKCADLNNTCTLPSGIWEVWFGKSSGNSWKVVRATGNVVCSKAVLGYPTGDKEKCYYRAPSSVSASFAPVAASTQCASEKATCTLPSGNWEVWYGAGNNWKIAPATGQVPCTNDVFTDPIIGTIKQCYYTPYSGSWTPTLTNLNSDGFFFARVQVCDRDSTTYELKEKRFWPFCTTYSDGDAINPQAAYKPTGVVQKYSDQLRLAAFGYLMDPNTSRYGGVLRAPMKYVGTRTFDINGVENTPSSGNSKQEWNSVTGQFLTNPENNNSVPTTDGRGTYLSGVVSYLNQFGRTGSTPGRYKTYDPIGELHYQAVRYLQGLQPSPSAVSSMSSTMYDGFPVYDTWADPYGGGRSSTADYACLKSNIVVIGDKNAWDYNNRLPTANAANNIPDIGYWQGIANNFESNTPVTYTDGQGATRTTGNPNGANTAAATSASGDVSLIGSAYWARTHDIRGASWTNATAAGTVGTALQRRGLRVKTFVFDVNENGGSNAASARRSSNQLFRAAKYGGFETDASNLAKNPFNTWGNPFRQEDGTANKYVWEDSDVRASRAGEANTYFLQSEARGVLSAFDDIFGRASTQARSIAGAAIQSGSLKVAEANAIFQGSFDTSDWSGDLFSIPISVDSSNNVTLSSTNNWSASSQLSAMSSPATTRNIVVGKVDASTSTATDFTWSSIESSLATHLDKENPSASADGFAQDRLNYLRGNRTKEGNPFRIRSKLLGDIINSGVAFSGEPTKNIISSTYSAFYQQQVAVTGTGGHAARTPAVFVGANDGMLHAFNATTGNELFAYIPSWLGPNLSALTSTTYNTSHQSYVDSTPVVAEAAVGTAGTADDWKTVLVSGTGGGGQGVFALDVTNPAAFSASKVMWEFTNHNDADMGYVLGRPQILKLRTSAYNATTATYKWYAVVPSGVNSYKAANSSAEFGSGNPTLFFLDLSKAAGTSWALGTNYFKVTLPIDSTLSTTKATGLINFSATIESGGEVGQMYMGDLHGNVWKLDFSLVGQSDWNINKLSAFKKGTSTSPLPYPLFIAKDASGNVQPITMAPSIASGPTRSSRYVFVGTGKYMESADKSSTAQQSAYMLYDDNLVKGGDSSPIGASAISGRTRLRVGTVNASTGIITVQAFTPGRALSGTDDLTVNTTVRSGWYFDFATSGERQTSGATISREKISFGSLIPGTSSASTCAAGGGGGNQYTVNIAGGNGILASSAVGLLGEPMLIEIPGATSYTSFDSTGKRQKTVTYKVIQQGSAGIGTGSTVTVTTAAGRLSWRQINNYQDLKN